MTTDTKAIGMLTGNMSFNSKDSQGTLRDEGSVRKTIRESLNTLLNNNLSDDEICSLGPVPVLEATVIDAASDKCNCHAFWEHEGLTCSIFHVTNENPSERYTKMLFVREFEGLKMALIVEMGVNDHIENSELGIISTKGRAGSPPILMFKLSGEDAGLVSVGENFNDAKSPFTAAFPHVDRDRFQSDKEYQEQILRYFRNQLFGLED